MAETFETTSWSVVMAAKAGDDGAAREALAQLCTTYWTPVYWHVRRRGYGEEDARDLTQEFFCRLLAPGFLWGVAPERGRFRTFLLASLEHLLRDEWRKEHAQKRGGAAAVLPLDFAEAEAAYVVDGSADADPALLFDRRWARALLDAVLARLAQEYREGGRGDLFEALGDCLAGGASEASHAARGAALGMSEGAVGMAVHRLRRRYAALIREEVARTVERPEDVREELRHLFEIADG